MKGALLGLLLLALNVPAMICVAICAVAGRYPWWLLTPDDPASPFGQYEEAVKRVYERFGRYVGDVYWLAFRNCLYGLAFRLKPLQFKGLRTYEALDRSQRVITWGTLYAAAGYKQWTAPLGLFCIMAGWKVDNVVRDPLTERQLINMDFRPIFSVRRSKGD